MTSFFQTYETVTRLVLLFVELVFFTSGLFFSDFARFQTHTKQVKQNKENCLSSLHKIVSNSVVFVFGGSTRISWLW
jgi:hypothetical protein